jgi:hypothetical protein
MTDTKAQPDRVWRLIEAAESESDQEAANILFREAERIAMDLHEVEPDNAAHCYAVALTYYHRWGSVEDRRKCLEWLNKTEDLDPSHPWVPLYRGYQYFDDNRFREAYEEFSRVDQSCFVKIDQHWRNIKTDELKIVSLIHGGSAPVDYRLLVRLVDRCAQADGMDRPVPVELVKAMADSANHLRFTSPAKDVAAEVCRLIRVCDVIDLFPDEFAALDAVSRAIG